MDIQEVCTYGVYTASILEHAFELPRKSSTEVEKYTYKYIRSRKRDSSCAFIESNRVENSAARSCYRSRVMRSGK